MQIKEGHRQEAIDYRLLNIWSVVYGLWSIVFFVICNLQFVIFLVSPRLCGELLRKMKQIKIDKVILTEKSSVFLVAEIGLNHNGKLELAKKLITKAKEAGADAVKFQVYRTEDFIHPQYAKKQFQLLKKYELSYDEVKQLKNFADKSSIIFFASPFDFRSVDFLVQIKTPVIKVASSELSNIYFLKYMAQKKLPMFISTGLHSGKEIKNSIHQIETINRQIVLFYCVSEYPLPVEKANLNAIHWFKENFNYLLGFSDHSDAYILDQLAVALGVKVIEKHFTLDKSLPGPDHKISLNVMQFKELVHQVKLTQKILGEKNKSITDNENKIKPFALKGIFAAKQIKKGEKISLAHIKWMRPVIKGRGNNLHSYLNQKSRRNYQRNEPL